MATGLTQFTRAGADRVSPSGGTRDATKGDERIGEPDCPRAIVIADVQSAAIDCQGTGIREVRLQGWSAAGKRIDNTIACHAADARVGGVGDINIAGNIDCNSSGAAQLRQGAEPAITAEFVRAVSRYRADIATRSELADTVGAVACPRRSPW